MQRLLKANCIYCNLLEFNGVILLDHTKVDCFFFLLLEHIKGWAVGTPWEEKLLMAENLREKLKKVKGHLKETKLNHHHDNYQDDHIHSEALLRPHQPSQQDGVGDDDDDDDDDDVEDNYDDDDDDH